LALVIVLGNPEAIYAIVAENTSPLKKPPVGN
jgi:hypothetical protein